VSRTISEQHSLDEMPSEFLTLGDVRRSWAATQRGSPTLDQQSSSIKSKNSSNFLVEIANPHFVIHKPLLTFIPVKNELKDSKGFITADPERKGES
jgi:hypothetical protein